MELLQLRYFEEVARTQHVTNSAKRLNVAQPALTQSIRRLERELGVKLIERVGRNVRLTPCGAVLHERVRPVLAALDALPAELAETAGREQATVRLAIESASTLAVEAIAAYRARRPNARFVVMQNADQRWDVRLRTARREGRRSRTRGRAGCRRTLHRAHRGSGAGRARKTRPPRARRAGRRPVHLPGGKPRLPRGVRRGVRRCGLRAARGV